MQTKKKLLSLLLAVAMVLTLFPVTALAADDTVAVTTRDGLKAALDDTSVSTINIAADIEMGSDPWVPAVVERSLTINGQGYTISGMQVSAGVLKPSGSGVAGDGGSCDYYAGFIGNNKSTLTINNLKFSNAVVDINPLSVNLSSTGSSILAVVCGNNTGTLVYNNVDVDGCVVRGYTKVGILHGFSQNSGTFVANQCSVTNSTVVLEADGTDLEAAFSGIIVGYDGNRKATTNGIKLSGNQCVIDKSVNWGSYNIVDGDNGVSYVDYNGTKYGLTCKTYTHGSTGFNAVEFAAEVNDYQYETLVDAITAAKNGDTVTLLKNVTENVTIAENIVLELNGKTLTGQVQVDGDLIVQDSVGNGKIISSATPVYVGDDENNTTGKLTLNSGTIESTGSYGVAVFNGSTAIVNDGKIQSYYACLSGNNTMGDMNFEVNGGTLTSQVSEAIYMPGQVSLKVTDGTINGGISTRMGQITVTGGTINGMTGSTDKICDYYSHSGSVWIGDAIYVLAGTYNSDNGQYGNTCNINISGGTINGNGQTGIAVYEIGTNYDQTVNVTISGADSKVSGTKGAVKIYSGTDITEHVDGCENGTGSGTVGAHKVTTNISITGGYFTSDPSDYVVDGYAAVTSDKDGYDYMVGQTATGVTLDKTTLSMTEHDIQTLTATVEPDTAVDKTVTWSSSDETVAIVTADGVVTAVGVGTATITAKAGDKSAACVVTVSPLVMFTVTFKYENGETEDVSFPVTSGTTFPLTYDDDKITEPSREGYTFAGWKSGEEIYQTGDDVTITADTTFVAQWSETLTEEVKINSTDPVVSTTVPAGATEAEEEAIKDTAEDVKTLTEEGLELTVADQKDGIASDAKTDPDYAKFVAENGSDVTIVIESYMDVAVTDATVTETVTSVTLDITPKYDVKVTTAPHIGAMDPSNTVTLVEGATLTVPKDEVITITLPVPGVFGGETDNLYVRHDSKYGTFYYKPAVKAGMLTFKNPHGFSEFTLIADSRAAEVEFLDENGNVAITRNLSPVDVNDALPTIDAPSGKRFTGWQFEGIEGTYETLTDDLLTALAAQDGKVTATPVFRNSGTVTPSVPEEPTYPISVPKADNGTVKVSRREAAQGDLVTVTVTPDEGYEIEEVTVTDRRGHELRLRDKGDGKYTFTMPASRVTVSVSFAEIEPEITVPAGVYIPVSVANLPFTDVPEYTWYSNAVLYVCRNGLMNGVSTYRFAPEATTSRAMIVTILYRLEGEPVVGTSAFTDVAPGAWYAKAVSWAAANGIVNGYGDGTFAPDKSITREEMAAILYRYAAVKSYDVSARTGLYGYADAAQVSGYAVDAMQWVNAEGLITGVTANTLVPQGSATRAEVATILMRFCENIAK